MLSALISPLVALNFPFPFSLSSLFLHFPIFYLFILEPSVLKGHGEDCF